MKVQGPRPRISWVGDMGSPVDGVVSIIWTVVSNVFQECYVPCTLKTYFGNCEKENTYCNSYKKQNISILLSSPYSFSRSQMLLVQFFPPFYLFTLILLNVDLSWICMTYLLLDILQSTIKKKPNLSCNFNRTSFMTEQYKRKGKTPELIWRLYIVFHLLEMPCILT